MTQYAFGPTGSSVKANVLYVDGAYTGAQNNGSFSAPYTTIAAALAVAAAGDVVKVFPGAYTEDLTLVDGVNVEGEIGPRGDSPTVTGTQTATDVSCSIKNMSFTDDGAGNAFYVTGTAGVVVTLEECLLVGTATGGSALECDNTAAELVVNRCQLVMTTGNAVETVRIESGTITCFDCAITHQDNTSEAFVAEGDAATTANLYTCVIQGSVGSEAAVVNPGMVLKACRITVGAVSGLVIAAGNTVDVFDCDITSTDAANDAIDGAGSLVASNLKFMGTADEIATTVTVTHHADSRIQTGKYTEAAGAGTRAITLPQVFPSTSYIVHVTYEDTGTGPQASSNEVDTLATTGFNLTTQGNGVYHWTAIHN